jgi:hypothetical protein
MYTDVYETLRTERNEGDIPLTGSDNVVRCIEHNLLDGALGENRGLGDVKFQVSIMKEYQFKLSQDLEVHPELGFDVPIIRMCYRSGLLELN